MTAPTTTRPSLTESVPAALLTAIIDKHWPEVYDARPFDPSALTLADVEHIVAGLDLNPRDVVALANLDRAI